MKLSFTTEVLNEVRDISGWYEKNKPGLSDEFLDELNRTLAAIQDNPLRFANLETVSRAPRVQRALLQRFSYIVVFRVHNDEIVLLAVAHTSRKPNYWKKRLS